MPVLAIRAKGAVADAQPVWKYQLLCPAPFARISSFPSPFTSAKSTFCSGRLGGVERIADTVLAAIRIGQTDGYRRREVIAALSIRPSWLMSPYATVLGTMRPSSDSTFNFMERAFMVSYLSRTVCKEIRSPS